MKKLNKQLVGFTGLGIGTGIGAAAVTSVGGDASGIKAMSSFYPVMGTMMGAGATLRQLNKFKKHY